MAVQTGVLGTGQGVALLLGGVLGPGLLVLPGLAAAAAGPASVLAWAGLWVLSVPVALTFAALGTRHPDGGGVSYFTRLAFGRRASSVVGLWFYFAIPVGTFAGALIGGEYIAATLGIGGAMPAVVAGGLTAASYLVNAVGLRLSGRLQLALLGLLIALLTVAILTAAPHAEAARFTPFMPQGVGGIGHAAGVLLFAFVGWEAVSHLSGEFDERGLRRATVVTLAVVGVLWMGLSTVTIGVLGGEAATTVVPLHALLETGIGEAARPAIGAAAVLLTFGALNTYIAGTARLGAALARDGVLPAWLNEEPGRTPHRNLALLAGQTAVVAVPVLVWAIDLDVLMRATAACLAAVTTVGAATAVRLLPSGRRRRIAVVAVAFTAVALACCGPYLAGPLLLSLVALRKPRLRALPTGPLGPRVKDRLAGCGQGSPQ